jgi:hypothetical protein
MITQKEGKHSTLRIYRIRGISMMRKLSKITALMVASVVLVTTLAMALPSTSLAFSVTPYTVEMYATSATPVYATPDVFSKVVVYLDRFINVRVTGITDNGFYQIDMNGTYYIPGAYLIASKEETKTEKQKALDNLEKFSKAYVNLLKQMDSYENKTFALIDITGDGVPELISGNDAEIYTYYNERAVMIYYSANPTTLYYSSKDKKLLGKYTWNSTEYWEVYSRDTSLLPWGQYICTSTDASPYKDNASTIEKKYTNNEETRNGMYSTLKEILEIDD